MIVSERCAGHPDGRFYRDPADMRVVRCIECEETGYELATLHVLDFPDITDNERRHALKARFYERRKWAGKRYLELIALRAMELLMREPPDPGFVDNAMRVQAIDVAMGAA